MNQIHAVPLCPKTRQPNVDEVQTYFLVYAPRNRGISGDTKLKQLSYIWAKFCQNCLCGSLQFCACYTYQGCVSEVALYCFPCYLYAPKSCNDEKHWKLLHLLPVCSSKFFAIHLDTYKQVLKLKVLHEQSVFLSTWTTG